MPACNVCATLASNPTLEAEPIHITPAVLAPVEERFGRPQEEHVTFQIGPDEMRMLVSSTRQQTRLHDVTVFPVNPDGQIAVIRKPSFPAGGYRAPSGGVKFGEDFVAAAAREIWEETGTTVTLQRYLLRTHVTFACDGFAPQPWYSHVFSGTCPQRITTVYDQQEIAEARFLPLQDLLGPVRQELQATGRGLLAYRIWLTDLVGAMLQPAIASLAQRACHATAPLSQ